MSLDIKYFIMILFTGLISSCTLTTTAPSDQGPKQAVGTITGMVLGGKIANDLTENSSKNNRLPNDKMIMKLENRNKILLELLKSNNLDNKHTGELDISIKNNYVRHHWTGFKG